MSARGLATALILAMLLSSALIGCTSSGAWQDYADLDEDSGVVAYQTGPDYIRVRFSDGSEYLYTYDSAGELSVENMKGLAEYGDGLNSYINQNVRYGYESKSR